MPDTKVTSSHGIVVASGSLNFDGIDASLYPLLMRRIQRSFNENKVPLASQIHRHGGNILN